MGKEYEYEKIYQKDLRNLIDYRREENNERLWNIANGLICLSGMDKINDGYHIVDKLVIDRILRRVGIDPGEIEMIIFKNDEERFQKRNQIYDVYNEKQYEQLEQLLQEYEDKTQNIHAVHRQFVAKIRAWMMIQQKKDIRLIISILKKAIVDTIPDFGNVPLKKISLAPEEMELIILLASCYRRKNELPRAEILLREVFDCAKKKKMSSKLRVKYIPFTCLELSKVYEAKHQYGDARYYALIGINILCCNAELQYLVALQEQYLKIESILENMGKQSSFRKKKIKKIKEERKAVIEVYKECKIDPYMLYPTEEYQNCYIFNELINGYRKFWKMERKEFCSDVCSIVAFSKIEKGITNPNRTFKRWMKKIGWPQTYYITQLHGCNMDHLKMYFRIERYIRRLRYKEAEQLFNQLEEVFKEKRLKDICPENRQYFLRIRTILEQELYQLSSEEAEERYKEILAVTVPKYAEIDLTKYPLRSQEVRILNNIAGRFFTRKDYRGSIKIWDKIEQQYGNSWICKNVYYNAYEVVLMNYASALGNNGEYKKSTKKIYQVVKYFLKKGSIERLGRCYYDIVWNKEQELLKLNRDVVKNKLCRNKLQQAEVLVRMIEDKFYIEFLKEYREKSFCESSK